MPIAYHIDPVHRLLEVVASGDVSLEDRMTFVATALADKELPSPLPILINVTGLRQPPESADLPGMARLVEVLSSHFRSRVAYFATGVGIVTPYILAAQAVREDLAEACTFANRAEAIKWLLCCEA